MNKNKAFLGIDPGKTGAAAIIHAEGHDLTDWTDVSTAAEKLTEWKFQYSIEAAALERVGAMPKQGVTSTFNFGVNFGSWQGLLSALGISYFMPRPQEWKKGLIHKGDGQDPKAASLAVARRLFPTADLGRKKDHGRAEALLLALWVKGKSF
jgi:hypothetical protein